MVLVKKYDKELLSISRFRIDLLKNKKGRPTEYAILDEEQTTFLITLMRNSRIVVDFKLRLAKEFYKQKEFLSNFLAYQGQDEYKQIRSAGKLSRKEETGVIQEFIEYATNQGSTNAKMYYANISSMENKAFFMLEQKFKNVREMLIGQQLGVISTADTAVKTALKDGMEKGMHYKDIYKLAKHNVEVIASVISKTTVPMLETDKLLIN